MCSVYCTACPVVWKRAHKTYGKVYKAHTYFFCTLYFYTEIIHLFFVFAVIRF